MKVILIDVITTLSKSLMPPLGLLYLSSYAKEYYPNYNDKDFLIKTFSADSDFDSFLAEIETISANDKLLFCTTMNTHNRFDIQKLSTLIKKRYKQRSLFLAGGAHATLDREVLEYCPNIDAVIIGEGEQTFLEILNNLDNGFNVSDFNKISGLRYKKNKEILSTPPRKRIQDLNKIPFPAREKVDMSQYIFDIPVVDPKLQKKLKATSMITSRGCPYNCVFCSVADQWGRTTTYRSIDNVLAEISELTTKYHCNSIYFFDDTFTLSRKRVEEFCQKLITSKINIYWFCEIRENTVDYNMLALMHKAGCRSVAMGVESGNQEISDNVVKKGINLDRVKDVVNWCADLGIYTKCFFSFSYPGETYKQALETLSYWKNLPANTKPIGRLRIYPGTPLFTYTQKKGYLPKAFNWFTPLKSYESASNPINVPYFNDRLTNREIEKILAIIQNKPKYHFHFKHLQYLRKIRNFSDLKHTFFKFYYRIKDNYKYL